MPAKSKKQQRFMAAVANNPKFAKKVGVPQDVGEEFMKMKKGYKAGGLEMAKDPKTGKMVPKFAMDGKGANDMRKGMRKGGKVYRAGGMTQGYNDRLDEAMGARDGKKKQPMRARRNESEGMERAMDKRKFAGDKSMPRMKSGGKVRGCGMARQGVRKAKMVSMKGS